MRRIRTTDNTISCSIHTYTDDLILGLVCNVAENVFVFLEESREERVVGVFSGLDAVELVAEVSRRREHFVQKLFQIVRLQVRQSGSAEEKYEMKMTETNCDDESEDGHRSGRVNGQ